jgi:hypothetical protein
MSAYSTSGCSIGTFRECHPWSESGFFEHVADVTLARGAHWRRHNLRREEGYGGWVANKAARVPLHL